MQETNNASNNKILLPKTFFSPMEPNMGFAWCCPYTSTVINLFQRCCLRNALFQNLCWFVYKQWIEINGSGMEGVTECLPESEHQKGGCGQKEGSCDISGTYDFLDQ